MSKEEKKSVKIAVFLTAAEADELKSRCEELRMSLPEFLRRAGLGRKIEPRKSAFDAAALEELRTATQNINQTARELSRARTKMIPLDFENLKEILHRQMEILHTIKSNIINYKS